MRETVVEVYLRRQIERLGGMCLKWVSPGNAGVPDRIVLVKRRVIFVETKAPGAKPRPLQRYVIGKLLAAGYDTRVIDTKEKVDRFIEEVGSWQ